MTVPTTEEREAWSSDARCFGYVRYSGDVVLRLLAALDEVERQRDEARRLLVRIDDEDPGIAHLIDCDRFRDNAPSPCSCGAAAVLAAAKGATT